VTFCFSFPLGLFLISILFFFSWLYFVVVADTLTTCPSYISIIYNLLLQKTDILSEKQDHVYNERVVINLVGEETA
jgi:hypothetical protein